MNYVEDRSHASSAEVLECFLEERQFLSQLAFLITGDQASADQSVLNACEMTVKGRSPFRDWLLEWAKAATITNAMSKCAETMSEREAGYKDQGCSHSEHTLQLDAEQRTANFNILLKTDTLKVVEELDALSRAVLVLRLAIGSSIRDCALRLNVGRATVLAANCRAMTWLCELRSAPVPEVQPTSSTKGPHDEGCPSHRRDRGDGLICRQVTLPGRVGVHP
jgi:hypothetical protein